MLRITEDCLVCGACEATCPTKAIREVERHYEIDPKLCISCFACVEACPRGAIVEE